MRVEFHDFRKVYVLRFYYFIIFGAKYHKWVCLLYVQLGCLREWVAPLPMQSTLVKLDHKTRRFVNAPI